MEEITLEQALNNIRIVLDNYQGKKADHIALDQSFEIVRKATIKEEVKLLESK